MSSRRLDFVGHLFAFAFFPVTLPLCLLLNGVVEMPAPANQAREPDSKDSRRFAGIALKTPAGNPVALADYFDKKVLVVIFIGTECPVNNAYMRPLKELHEEFVKKDVR